MRWELIIEIVMQTIQRTYPWLVADSVITMMHDAIRMSNLNVLLWSASLGSIVIYFIGFAETWWWEPFYTIPVLMGIYTADMFFAVIRTGRVNGKNFEFCSTKFNKYIIDLIGVIIMLGLIHAFPLIGNLMMEHDDTIGPIKRDFVYHGLVVSSWGAYFAIATRQALSAVANAAKAGIIPHEAGRFISKHIDTYKSSVFDDMDKK